MKMLICEGHIDGSRPANAPLFGDFGVLAVHEQDEIGKAYVAVTCGQVVQNTPWRVRSKDRYKWQDEEKNTKIINKSRSIRQIINPRRVQK
jgi:hypothetical protein